MDQCVGVMRRRSLLLSFRENLPFSTFVMVRRLCAGVRALAWVTVGMIWDDQKKPHTYIASVIKTVRVVTTDGRRASAFVLFKGWHASRNLHHFLFGREFTDF